MSDMVKGALIIGVAIVLSQGIYDIEVTGEHAAFKTNKYTGSTTVCYGQNCKLINFVGSNTKFEKLRREVPDFTNHSDREIKSEIFSLMKDIPPGFNQLEVEEAIKKFAPNEIGKDEWENIKERAAKSKSAASDSNLKRFRAKFPQYNDIKDEKIIASLQKKHKVFSEWTEKDFYEADKSGALATHLEEIKTGPGK